MVTLAGKQIGPIGFGLMGITWRPVQTPDEQAFAAMKQALASGSNFWNGGEFYGPPESNSLQLLNRYFTKYPEDADKVVISIKGGLGPDMQPDGSEEGVRRSVDNCLRLLGGAKKLDVFECARVDPKIPIETTIAALGKLVKEGKIAAISLSECSADTVRRAAKVHPIAAVEVEVSLWEDNVLRNGVAQACAENSIPVVAYSPIGRGFLTGQLQSIDDLPEGDMRRHFPRFQPDAFPKNLELVQKIQAIADSKGCTAAQLALGWVRQLSSRKGMPTFVPIPGATSASRVKENMQVVDLSDAEMAEVDKVLDSFTVAGTRYPAAHSDLLDG